MHNAGRPDAFTRCQRDDLGNRITVTSPGMDAGAVGARRDFNEGRERGETQGDADGVFGFKRYRAILDDAL